MPAFFKTKIVWMLLALFVAMGSLSVFAMGPGFGPAHGRGFGIRFLFLELDLSNEQKATILNVLETYEDDILDTMGRVVTVRKAFETRIKAEGFDETLVRQAYQKEMSLALEDAAVVRVKIWSAVRNILTEDQIKQLEEKRAKIEPFFSQHAKHRLEMIRSFLQPVSQ